MKVGLEFYGVLRGLMGHKEMSLDVADGATIREAIDHLVQISNPAVGRYIRPSRGGYAVRFSVNGMVQNDDHIIDPNDTIKLLVPMSGG